MWIDSSRSQHSIAPNLLRPLCVESFMTDTLDALAKRTCQLKSSRDFRKAHPCCKSTLLVTGPASALNCLNAVKHAVRLQGGLDPQDPE